MVDQNKKIIDRRRDEELNLALEAIHFGFKNLISTPDELLAELGYSRIHHRILYFIATNPGCSINELLGIMQVSKQYLNRPLKQLTDAGYVNVKTDSHDKRVKRVSLSKQGSEFEFELSDNQRQRFERVFLAAGPRAEAGWRKVMRLLALPSE